VYIQGRKEKRRKKRNARRSKAFVRKTIPLLKVLFGPFSFKKKDQASN
jgi:hypothetical protein